MSECGQCASLRSQLAELQAQVMRLQLRVDQLEEMRGQVIGIVGLIDSEYRRQTMPRTRLLWTVDERLRHATGLPLARR